MVALELTRKVETGLILQALNVLTALLSVAVVVLLFGPEANRHFKPEANNQSAQA